MLVEGDPEVAISDDCAAKVPSPFPNAVRIPFCELFTMMRSVLPSRLRSAAARPLAPVAVVVLLIKVSWVLAALSANK